MKVALFTHTFLEPTHHAIAQVINSQRDIQYIVFAKRFYDHNDFKFYNIIQRNHYNQGFINDLKSQGFDLIHAIYDGQTAINAAMNAFESEIPFMLSFHGGFDTNAKIFLKKYKDKTREIVQLADVVTVPSEYDIQQLRKIGVTRYIEILPVPVDKNKINGKINRQDGRLVIVGRLIPKKGIDIGLHSLKKLSQTFHLIIIGDGPEKKLLQNICKENNLEDRVSWLGMLPLDSMLSELQKSDILIHPAKKASDGNNEGTPQIILWAQAIGLPVIASETGGISQIVENGLTGMLVKAGDVDKLSSTIIQLNTDIGLRNKIIIEAKQSIFPKHSISSISDKLYKLYCSIENNKSLETKLTKDKSPLPSINVVTSRNMQNIIKNSLFDFLNKSIGYNSINTKIRLEPFARGGQTVLFKLYLNGHKSEYLFKMPEFNSFDKSFHGLLCHNILKEARALSEIDTMKLNVTPRLFMYEESGKFLLRELIEGNTLSELINKNMLCSDDKKLLLFKLIKFSRILFKIFHSSQRKSYVIRDFKPRNIVLSSDINEFILVDVGSAKLESDMVIKSSRKQRIGTGHWLYWAPEQLLNDGRKMDKRVDFFAFGATAYYLLFESSPYSNKQPDRNLLMDSYFKEYKAINELLLYKPDKFDVQKEIKEFIVKCLNPNEKERPDNFENILKYEK